MSLLNMHTFCVHHLQCTQTWAEITTYTVKDNHCHLNHTPNLTCTAPCAPKLSTQWMSRVTSSTTASVTLLITRLTNIGDMLKTYRTNLRIQDILMPNRVPKKKITLIERGQERVSGVWRMSENDERFA